MEPEVTAPQVPFLAGRRPVGAILSIVPRGIKPGALVGVASLLVAEASVLLFPPTIVPIALAAVATALLALDRRLGALGAALLVVVALPFGRASDLDPVHIGSVPVHPQDVAIGVGLLLALPAVATRVRAVLRSREPLSLSRAELVRHLPTVVVYAFLAAGLFALGLGVAHKNDMQDILRDARWWALYGAILIALWRPGRFAPLVRGLIAGSILFACVILLTAILPDFSGALKDRALQYDWGALRLQFTNDVFLVPALAFATFQAMRRPGAASLACVALFTCAITLSLTRTSMLVGAGVIALVAVVVAWQLVGRRQFMRLGLSLGRVVVVAAAGMVLALSILILLPNSIMPAANSTTSKPGTSTSPISRITFTDPSSNVDAIEAGRFAAYRKAVSMIARAPVGGSGLGALVYLGTNFGDSDPSKPGFAAGVDDAYLTVAMKAGIIGLLPFAALMFIPFAAMWSRRWRRLWQWYVPAWLGLMGLAVTQSYAVSGYGPFALALLLVVPILSYRSSSASRAAAQE
jgi:O-antigen ligase